MLKKLTEEKIGEILETGIAEFAENGLDRANINVIAKKAGISVGVLYKYYQDKEAFFMACLDRSLSVLDSVIETSMEGEDKLLVRAEKIIRALQFHSRTHVNYIKMYNEITTGSTRKHAVLLAQKIEGISSRVYSQFIAQAMDEGDIRNDIDPHLFAFFFDNLLMMLHFAYGCDYYRERFKIFCGAEILDNDEKVVTELLKFLESAFTLEKAAIPHRG